VIVDAIRHRRDVKQGREAILSELEDLAVVLTLAGHKASRAVGRVDRAHLEWVRNNVDRGDDQHKDLLDWVERMLGFSDEQIAQAAAHAAATDETSPVLQIYPAPLLDSRVAAIWTFETPFQRKLLTIKRSLSLLDETVVQLRQYFRMTFDAQVQGSRQRIDSNIAQLYSNYAERARVLVDQISKLRSEA